MPDNIRFSNDPAPEVLSYFRNKGLTPSFDWRDVWPQEHAHAFTVAKATQIEVLSTIREAIDQAIVNGVPFEQFRATLEPRLRALGWWGRQAVTDTVTGETVDAQLGSPRRLRIIYDANIRTAIAAGLWERIQRSKAILPFLIYIETTSKEPREEHLEWAHEPVVLPVDDPWWETHFPPNGWQCKCSVLQVDEEEAKAAGWTKKTKAPALDEQAWFNKRTGDTEMVPKGIDPGWATNPGFTRQRLLEEYLAGRMTDAEPALKEVIARDLTSNWLFKKMTDGEFYKFGQPAASGTLFAAPIGVVPPEIAKAAGAKNGVIWLTPDGAFAIGKTPLEKDPSTYAAVGGQPRMPASEWMLATRVLDEGAVIRVPSVGDKPNPGRFGSLFPQKNPDAFTVYRLIDGQYYRVDFSLRDRTFDGQKIPGDGRLTIESFHKVSKRVAEKELLAARYAGTLLKEQQGAASPEPYQLPPGAGGPAGPAEPSKYQPDIGPGGAHFLPPGASGPAGPGAPSNYQPYTGTGGAPLLPPGAGGPAGPGDASTFQPYVAPKAAPTRSKKTKKEDGQ